MKTLPPGQKESKIFPRFGLPPFANRFPSEIDVIKISIGGDIEAFEIIEALHELPRVNQTSDFHCVTTWSKLNLNWSGYTFKDFYSKFIAPKVYQEITYVVLKAQDGYKTSLPLEDLLQDNVLLADELDAGPLNIEHGAPLRIIAPDHYGYKNLKHINRIEFYFKEQKIKQGLYSFMDHPRARVALEERATIGPALFFRWLYRFGIKGTIKEFEEATAKFKQKNRV